MSVFCCTHLLTNELIDGSKAIRIQIATIRAEQNEHLIVDRDSDIRRTPATVSMSTLKEQVRVLFYLEPILFTWTLFLILVARDLKEFGEYESNPIASWSLTISTAIVNKKRLRLR